MNSGGTNGERPGRGRRALAAARAHLPVLTWSRTYRRAELGGDLVAGLVVSALLVPQALGYAAIAGVPVEVGLYAVPLALLAYAALGSSRQLVVGPVSTMSVVSGTLVAGIAAGDPDEAVVVTAALAVATGAVLLVVGLLRLGWMAEFLSKPIVTGFVFGLTLTIVIGELPGLLGVPKPAGDLLTQVWDLLGELGEVDATTLAVGAAALLVLFVGGRLAPRVPWGLLTLVAGIAASKALDLASHGVAIVGEVPAGLPRPGFPWLALDQWPDVLAGGASLALVGMAEGLSAARLFDGRSGSALDADQELLATGAANVAAGLSGGLAVGGSLSKTAASARAGGRSQVAGLVTAVVVVVVLLFLTGVFTDLPRAVLGAIVVNAVWGLMDLRALRRYGRIRRADQAAALVAVLGVVLYGPLYGLGVAIGISLLTMIYRFSRPSAEVMGKIPGEKAAWGRTSKHPERRPVDGLVVLRLDAPVFWVNASAVREQILAAVDARPGTRAVILDLEGTTHIDTTSCDMLAELLVELRARGVDLYLVRVFHVARRVLERAGLVDVLGEGHVWHSISQCVRAARKQLRHARGAPAAEEAPGAAPAERAEDLLDEEVDEEVDEEHIAAAVDWVALARDLEDEGRP